MFEFVKLLRDVLLDLLDFVFNFPWNYKNIRYLFFKYKILLLINSKDLCKASSKLGIALNYYNDFQLYKLYFALMQKYESNGNIEEYYPYLQNLIVSYPDNLSVNGSLFYYHQHKGAFEEMMFFNKKIAMIKSRAAIQHNFETSRSCYYSSYYTRAFGHIGMLGVIAKSKILGLDGDKDHILLIDEKKVSNLCLLNYLRPYFIFKKSSRRQEIIFDVIEKPIDIVEINGKYKFYVHAQGEIDERWNKQKKDPLLKLNERDIEYGWAYLKKIGISKDSWFVTLHVREIDNRRADLQKTEPRNANIESYIKAIEMITNMGGVVIRIGNSTMPKLPKMENVVDYAHMKTKTDNMDVFLIASCRFFIGTTSGPTVIPSLFGKRVIHTNIPTLGYHLSDSNCIAIPKLVRSTKTGETIKFKDIITSYHAYATSSKCMKGDYELIDNSPDDICNAVMEMIHNIAGNCNYELSANQLRFKNLCSEYKFNFRPSISESFLSKHNKLL